MTIFSKKSIAAGLSAVILSTTIMTSVDVSSAQAGMRGHNVERMGGHHRGHRGGHRGGHFGRDMAIGMGVLGALAIISAVQASNNAVPAHVKRRCEQAREWDKLVESANELAEHDRQRGDMTGFRFMKKEAARRQRNAAEARRDCKRWMAEYR